jgi:arginase
VTASAAVISVLSRILLAGSPDHARVISTASQCPQVSASATTGLTFIAGLVLRQPRLSGGGPRTGPGSLTLVSRVSVVGVPSSAASYAAGQDLAPAALRSAGLLEQLTACGLEVHDDGDLPHQAWSPDRDHPRAQNAGQATVSVQQLADRLGPLLARGDIALVLGGNCTIALGVVAALWRLGAGAPGLLYVDRHYDLNTPESTSDGALDWMGLAHALALPGCLDTLTGAFGQRPLLEPDQVAWLGVEPRMATQWEREQASRLGLHVTSSQALAADPAAAALAALSQLPAGPLALHLDVDVLDFIDAPLAENTDCRNTGPTLDQVAEALTAAARDQRMRALSIGELNPTRCAGDADALSRFVTSISRVLAATTH